MYLLVILQRPPSCSEAVLVLSVGSAWIDSNERSYDRRSLHLSLTLDQNHTAECCCDPHIQWISQTLKYTEAIQSGNSSKHDSVYCFFPKVLVRYIPNWQIKGRFLLQSLVASHWKPESLSMCPHAAPGSGLLTHLE